MKKYVLGFVAGLVFFTTCGFSLKYAANAVGTVNRTGEYRYIYSLNSSTNLYARIIKVDNQTSSHKIWNENTGAFGAVGAVSWANSAISTTSTNSTLTDNTLTVGGYLLTFDSDIGDGVYDVLFYDNATPVAADTLLLGRQVVIEDGEFAGFNDL